MASSGDLFEQNKPSLFGSSQQNAFSTTTPSTGLFRSGIAGAQGSFGVPSYPSNDECLGARTGTTIKFDAPRDKDTIMQNKEMQWIDTRHVCITAMREYDGKSFEVGAAFRQLNSLTALGASHGGQPGPPEKRNGWRHVAGPLTASGSNAWFDGRRHGRWRAMRRLIAEYTKTRLR